MTSHLNDLITIDNELADFRARVHQMIHLSANLTPVHTLPIEILSRIFELAIHPCSCVDEYNYVGHATRRYPLVAIPSVCTRWRQITTETPSLWSHVDIEVYYNARDPQKESERILLWLKRAQDVPIHLHFTSSSMVIDIDYLGNLIRPFLPRAAFFTFEGVGEDTLRYMLDLHADIPEARSLMSLSVKMPRPTENNEYTWPTRIFQNLIVLELECLPELMALSMDEIVSILLGCPRLCSLQLQNVTVLGGGGNYPRISLPDLESLEVAIENRIAIRQILSLLLLGSHELDVRLRLPEASDQNSYQAIKSFFGRSNVVFLSLGSLRPTGVAWLAGILDCLPHLRGLHLNCQSDPHGVSFGALTDPIGQQPDVPRIRCPNLRVLAITKARIGFDAQRIIRSYKLSRLIIGYRATFVDDHETYTDYARDEQRSLSPYYAKSVVFEE